MKGTIQLLIVLMYIGCFELTPGNLPELFLLLLKLMQKGYLNVYLNLLSWMKVLDGTDALEQEYGVMSRLAITVVS